MSGSMRHQSAASSATIAMRRPPPGMPASGPRFAPHATSGIAIAAASTQPGPEGHAHRPPRATLALTADYQAEIHGVSMALVRLSESDEDVRAALEDRMRRRRRGLGALVERLAKEGRLYKEWSNAEVVDALWEAGAPSSYQHLVVERGWKPVRYRDWLIWLARSFLRKR